MSPATKVLREAKLAAKLKRVSYASHARTRMNERGATDKDVLSAIETATAASDRTDRAGRWRLEGGTDVDGDRLDVVVQFDVADVMVITVIG